MLAYLLYNSITDNFFALDDSCNLINAKYTYMYRHFVCNKIIENPSECIKEVSLFSAF